MTNPHDLPPNPVVRLTDEELQVFMAQLRRLCVAGLAVWLMTMPDDKRGEALEWLKRQLGPR